MLVGPSRIPSAVREQDLRGLGLNYVATGESVADLRAMEKAGVASMSGTVPFDRALLAANGDETDRAFAPIAVALAVVGIAVGLRPSTRDRFRASG